MQEVSSKTVLRGVQAMTDYANSRLAGGKPFTYAAIYRLISDGMIRVTRLGDKGGQIFSTVEAIDQALGLSEPAPETEGDEAQAA